MAALAVTAFTIGLVGQTPFVRSAVSESDQPLTRAVSPDDRVALTFDVTWGQEELSKILTSLKAANVKATFFVGGTFTNLYGERVKQIYQEGHEIGTLGQKIVDLSVLSEQEVLSNLLESQSALTKILGTQVRYFRPPQGDATPALVRGAREANLITVTSSLDSRDHMGLRSNGLIRRVVGRAQRGDVILLSASDWSTETAKALPAIIKGLHDRGFKLVGLSELVPIESAPQS